VKLKHYWSRYHGFLVGIELDHLKDCIETVNKSFEEAFERLGERVSEQTKGLSPEKANELAEWFAGDAFNLKEHFPAYTNSAMFVALYSYLEHELLQICKKLEQAKVPIKIKERGGIQDHRKSLVDAGIKFPEKSPEWKEICKLQHVRNVIAHRRGYVKRPKKGEPRDPKDRDVQVIRHLARKKSARLKGADQVELQAAFCLEFIEVIRSFIEKLVKRLPPS